MFFVQNYLTYTQWVVKTYLLQMFIQQMLKVAEQLRRRLNFWSSDEIIQSISRVKSFTSSLTTGISMSNAWKLWWCLFLIRSLVKTRPRVTRNAWGLVDCVNFRFSGNHLHFSGRRTPCGRRRRNYCRAVFVSLIEEKQPESSCIGRCLMPR